MMTLRELKIKMTGIDANVYPFIIINSRVPWFIVPLSFYFCKPVY